jgi:hypothetical protein
VTYEEFLKSKAPVALDRGYSGPLNLNQNLKAARAGNSAAV